MTCRAFLPEGLTGDLIRKSHVAKEDQGSANGEQLVIEARLGGISSKWLE